MCAPYICTSRSRALSVSLSLSPFDAKPNISKDAYLKKKSALMTKYSSAANTEKCVRAYHYYKLLSFRWHRIFTLTVAHNEQFLVTLSAQVHRTADLKLGDRERERLVRRLGVKEKELRSKPRCMYPQLSRLIRNSYLSKPRPAPSTTKKEVACVCVLRARKSALDRPLPRHSSSQYRGEVR